MKIDVRTCQKKIDKSVPSQSRSKRIFTKRFTNNAKFFGHLLLVETIGYLMGYDILKRRDHFFIYIFKKVCCINKVLDLNITSFSTPVQGFGCLIFEAVSSKR